MIKTITFLATLTLAAQVWACKDHHVAANTAKPATTLAAATATTATTTTSANTQVFKVEGMTCTGCEQSIQAEVTKVPGVKSVKADHKTGTVTVETDGKTAVDKAAFSTAVTKAGEYKVK